MGSYFNSYVSNLNRVRMAELIDYHMLKHRSPPFRASLIANPLTGLPYRPEQDGCEPSDVAELDQAPAEA